MRIRVNWAPGMSTMGTSYYVQKAVTELGHEAIQTQDPSTWDVVIDVEGYPLIKSREGIPYFYWETDSFLLSQGNYPAEAVKVFYGGAPDDASKYPPEAIFLPHAFDEEVHRPIEVEKEFDIVMVGSEYPERRRLLELLKQHFNVGELRGDPGLSYSQAMSKGKLIFNRSKTDFNIPMRFFEGMAIGALLTNETNNLQELATPYKHYIPYSTDEELISNAKKYLEDDKLREDLIKEARKHALKNHTYKHRVRTILSYL